MDKNENYSPSAAAKVLLVDDMDMILYVIKGKLAHYGLEVDTALSGQEAIEKIKKNDYDIIFMDYMMPEMNGIEAAKNIRKLENENNTKANIIIALTSNEIFDSEFNGFLAKPVVTQDLEKILKKWLPAFI